MFTRGQRIAIVGPNGAGKTTFLRILNGELNPDRGSVRYGVGLRTASYSQSSVDDLPAGATAADAVMRMGVDDQTARGLLGRLNLGGDAGDKRVEEFSGGERRRIMLARLMAQRADCLFLDEPTNDLDIASREALEDVLAEYDGALFVVSHDRYLLKRLGDRVVEIRDGAARVLDVDYEAYERGEHERTAPAPTAIPASPRATSQRASSQRTATAQPPPDKRAAHDAKQELFRMRRAVTDAEQRVARLDQRRRDLELEFAAPDLYDDPQRVVDLQHALDANRSDAEAALADWERAVLALEARGTAR